MNSIIIKIQALFAALYMFFIGIAYPNSTPKVDFTAEINFESIVNSNSGAAASSAEKKLYSVTCKVNCKNVGDPFKGDRYFSPTVVIYKGATDSEQIIQTDTINEGVVDNGVPIGRGQEFSGSQTVYFNSEDPLVEPGAYSVKVSVYGNTQYFENAFVIE